MSSLGQSTYRFFPYGGTDEAGFSLSTFYTMDQSLDNMDPSLSGATYQAAMTHNSELHYHHHSLPGQDLDIEDDCSISMVGQPGMPPPAPRPHGPKLKFTEEDDMLLIDLKEKWLLTWKQVSDFFPGRTSGTLQVRYCTKLKSKGPVQWTAEMDDRLQNALQEYEKEKWHVIARRVGARTTPTACHDRAKGLKDLQADAQSHGTRFLGLEVPWSYLIWEELVS